MKEEPESLEHEENMVSARFILSYQNTKSAKAIFSSLLVDNEEFNKGAGKRLVESRLDDNCVSLVVKGRSIASFRATADDLMRSLLAVEKIVCEVEKREGR